MFSWRRVWKQLPSGMWRRVVYLRIRRTVCIRLHLHWRQRQMVPLQRQKTYTRLHSVIYWTAQRYILDCTALYTGLHSVIYQKKAIIITRNGWQTRVLGRNLTAGKFKTAVGTALLLCQDHLQARQLLRSSYGSFHCVLFTTLLWKISGKLQLQKNIQNNTPATRGGTRVLTVYNANVIAR